MRDGPMLEDSVQTTCLHKLALLDELKSWTLVIMVRSIHLLKEHLEVTVRELASMLPMLWNVHDRMLVCFCILRNTQNVVRVTFEVAIDARLH